MVIFFTIHISSTLMLRYFYIYALSPLFNREFGVFYVFFDFKNVLSFLTYNTLIFSINFVEIGK